MKHFIYTKTESKNGKNYTLKIYESKGKNKRLEHVGNTRSISYGMTYGEEGEAWQVILEKQPHIKDMLKKRGIVLDLYYFNLDYSGRDGIILQGI